MEKTTQNFGKRLVTLTVAMLFVSSLAAIAAATPGDDAQEKAEYVATEPGTYVDETLQDPAGEVEEDANLTYNLLIWILNGCPPDEEPADENETAEDGEIDEEGNETGEENKTYVEQAVENTGELIFGVLEIVNETLNDPQNGSGVPESVWILVRDWFDENVWSPVTGFFDDAAHAVGDGIRGAGNAIGMGFENVTNATANGFEDIAGAIGNAAQGAWDGVKGIGDSIGEGLHAIGDSVVGFVNNLFGGSGGHEELPETEELLEDPVGETTSLLEKIAGIFG